MREAVKKNSRSAAYAAWFFIGNYVLYSDRFFSLVQKLDCLGRKHLHCPFSKHFKVFLCLLQRYIQFHLQSF